MQTLNNPAPPPMAVNAPFYNEYHYPQGNTNYPPPPSPLQNNNSFPPPPVYVPMPAQHHPQILTQPNMVPVRIPNYAHNISDPITIVCPCCREMVVTSVTRSSGKATYISAMLLCAINPMVAFIPFCAKKKCKDVRHYCPNCGMMVGKKKGEMCGSD